MTLADLLAQRATAIRTCTRWDHEHFTYREGRHGTPQPFADALGDAKATLAGLDRAIARAREEERKAVEEEARRPAIGRRR